MSNQKAPKTYAGVKGKLLRWIRKDGKDGAAADFGFVRTEHGHEVFLSCRVLWTHDLQITPKPGDMLVLHYREGNPSYQATTVVSYEVAPEQPRQQRNKKQKKSAPKPVTGRGRVTAYDAEKGIGFLELDERFGIFAAKTKVCFDIAAIKASMDRQMPDVPVSGDWLQCTVNPARPVPTATNLVALELADRGDNVVVLDERRKTGTDG